MTRCVCVLVAAAALAACDHTPAGSFLPPERGPLTDDNPHRVTYNLGADLRPSWAADGSGFWYTRERTDRADGDRCLGFMAPGGGALRDELCDHTAVGADSLTSFESAAVAADGRFAYVRASTRLIPSSLAPATHELRVGSLTNRDGATVRSLPYTASSGQVHGAVADLQWLSATELLYLGQQVTYEAACSGCAFDTLRAGLEVVRLNPATGVPSVVTGTDAATSVAVVGADSIYFTLPGDGQVLRRSLSNAATAVAHDFGPGANARDVSVATGVLAAVTGRGLLWLVQLTTGAQTPLTASQLVFFQRPALAPNGRHLVAEGYPFHIDTIRNPSDGSIAFIDTVVSQVGDLWVFDLP